MKLDTFLNDRGIDMLQDFQNVWLPGRLSGSKAALLRSLRSAMLNRECISRVIKHLSFEQRRCLSALLRQPHYRATIEELAAQLPSGECTLYLARHSDMLAHMGLVHLNTSDSSVSLEKRILEVPEELAELLVNIMGVERRPVRSLLSLAAHASPGELDKVRSTASTRIARLNDNALRAAIPNITLHHFGILPLKDFATLNLNKDPDSLHLYRTALEESSLGTIGGLTLWAYGIDLDETCLIIYQEVVESLLSIDATQVPPDFHLRTTGSQWLCDVRALIDYLEEHPLTLTASGELHKVAARRAAEHVSITPAAGFSPNEIFELTIRLASHMRLTEADDLGHLRTAETARTWENLPLSERLAHAVHNLTACAPTPAEFRYPPILEHLLDLVKNFQPGTWYRAATVATRAICRFLLHEPPPAPPLPARPKRLSLAHLKEHIAMAALLHLHALGLLDAGLLNDKVECVRISALGRRALKSVASFDRRNTEISAIAGIEARHGEFPAARSLEQIEPQTRQVLIVNPDFEVVLFPEGEIDDLLYQLCRFCERQKSDLIYHLKLTKSSVERGVLGGLTADHIIALLHQHSRTPIPQNVIYSIHQWASHVRLAAISEVCLLETAESATLDLIQSHPAIRPLLVRRISPTAAILAARPADAKVIAVLKRLGIHVRNSLHHDA